MNYLLEFLGLKSNCQIRSNNQDYGSRNAFIHFLKDYRNKNTKIYFPIQRSQSVTDFVRCAAKTWREMKCEEKRKYYCEAKREKYIYLSRNKRFNKVMKRFRKVFNDKANKKCRSKEFSEAACLLRRWKYNVIKNI